MDPDNYCGCLGLALATRVPPKSPSLASPNESNITPYSVLLYFISADITSPSSVA